MKKCIKCNKKKKYSDFYSNKNAADGYSSSCKKCKKEYQRKRHHEKFNSDPEWVESERKRGREKYFRLGYKDKHSPTPDDKKKSINKYKNKYPEKVSTRSKSSHIRGKFGFQFHHWSYNDGDEKSVILMTRLDHSKLHRNMKYDEDNYIYLDNDGNLLDTKQKHINYAKDIGCLVFADCEF